ncbi:MAG: antibiotic biosynthesis monooxygenase family protein [Anaerolineales bacterium]
MSDPVSLIIRFKVKKGKFDDFRKHYKNSIPPVEAGKPGTLVQLAYENEDATEVSVLRLFSSADAMEAHLQGSGERSKKTYEYVTPISIEILGRPNASIIERMKKTAGSGVALSVNLHYIGGFIR